MSEQIKSQFISALEFRHACKEFDSERKISPSDFDFILQSMRLAPSSFGLEPWQFVVIQDMTLREKIKEHAWGGQNQIPTASHFVVAMHNKGAGLRYDGPLFDEYLFKRRELPPEMEEKYRGFVEQFQENDFDLLQSQRNLDDWAGKQIYIPLAHMLIAAAMLKIDSCPMEGFNRVEVGKLLADELAIDAEVYSPAFLIAFGYRKNQQPNKLRRSLDSLVKWA
ncbi:NAD(P)H-dependent oxidoreductase [Piscirickettsia litoralis]|uniref:NAD(P)H-dependent oxidoreductase n=1 Tax=Piscirickettsia litoralis TaxID=1891921 RepID=A0ABX3A6I1_9GAMM|nr:NAD(P)H-dependent oxidoreductase [Piscirickettsia litoralis]ODN41714.1 NAD(P)H-dependent oxidoreductase [Piscirickettsia litoralis]